jgi:hypothetical protein
MQIAAGLIACSLHEQLPDIVSTLMDDGLSRGAYLREGQAQRDTSTYRCLLRILEGMENAARGSDLLRFQPQTPAQQVRRVFDQNGGLLSAREVMDRLPHLENDIVREAIQTLIESETLIEGTPGQSGTREFPRYQRP